MQQEESGKTKRIKQVAVTNLFGLFNHIIPLKTDDRITIIHSPNGFGKTIMLKLLHALFSQSNRLFQNIRFDEFRVDFENNTSFWVKKTSQFEKSAENEHISEQEIVFHATEKEPFSLHLKPFLKENLSIPLSAIDRLIPVLERVGPEIWRYIPTSEFLSLEDVIERFGGSFPEEMLGTKTKLPEWLVDMRKSVPIRVIETQRLLGSGSAKLSRRSEYEKKTVPEYAVTEDSMHLVDLIRRKLVESGTLAQSLDSSFPVRFISPTVQQPQLTEEELLNKLVELEKKRLRLIATGLLDQEAITAGFPVVFSQQRIGLKIRPDAKSALEVYVKDTEQKLGIFDELAQKIDLLTTIINNRFLYKTITIHKEKGFVFKTKNGATLPLENLSSGEQHELVLFYELLFRIMPGSLILIDEPELSLHVVWQEQFLEDVKRITELTDIDIILATHSPDIIGNRRDLVVKLEGPEDGQL